MRVPNSAESTATVADSKVQVSAGLDLSDPNRHSRIFGCDQYDTSHRNSADLP